ncbi:aldo/keto reductase [Corynebacterium sputi]|uniref:aldo/keto reductase n=1 Tax=Corynebacterium sputi TaxID=489915 RepID=UPI00042A5DD4|nr:aldo/keto reductase [Corynebacterium sputi]
MTNTVPTLTLNNGVQMPALGFGVYQSSPEDTAAAVRTALETGYRHIDTAAAYGNEREVGDGIRASGVDRSDIFIETKVWLNDYGFDSTRYAFDKAASKLGVDTIDLLLLHQPMSDDFDRTIDAYRGLESLLHDGHVHSIGISNFMPSQVEELLSATEVVPAVNQIENHPYFQQCQLQELNAEHGIVTQAWSPIGGITFYAVFGDDRVSVLDDAVIREIARAHGKSPAQVMLRWHLDQRRSAIPKSVTPSRIAENFDVFDFSLSTDELAAIDALDTGNRGGPVPEDITLVEFSLEILEA